MKGLVHLPGVRVEVRTIRGLQQLDTWASPTVMGKIVSRLKVQKLINSGSEMSLMSGDLYERTKGLLPVDKKIGWSIG